MKKFFLALILVFLASSFSLAAGKNVNELKDSYLQLLENLVILLNQKIKILENSSSSPAAVSGQSTSSVNVIPFGVPTWHLVPGSCFPQLY